MANNDFGCSNQAHFWLEWPEHTSSRSLISSEAKKHSLLRLVNDFYGSDLCVIYLRREGKQ